MAIATRCGAAVPGLLRGVAPAEIRPGAATRNLAHRIGHAVVLSDRTIRRLLDEGRIGIDPYDEALLQPSSVDVRVDRYFRVFRNSRYPYIDVKEPQEELTELVEIDDEPFILHPGRVRARLDARTRDAAGRSRRPARREVNLAASACSSTRPPASSTPAGTAT